MNLLYKFKVSGMSDYDMAGEIILRARSSDPRDFKKLKYLAETKGFQACFESVVQRVIVSGESVVLHRLMLLPQVSGQQKKWALWFASRTSDPDHRASMVATMFLHRPPSTQEEKDKWLAEFLMLEKSYGIELMVKHGANVEQALAIVDQKINAQKDKLEEKKGHLDSFREKIRLSCEKIGASGAKLKP